MSTRKKERHSQKYWQVSIDDEVVNASCFHVNFLLYCPSILQ